MHRHTFAPIGFVLADTRYDGAQIMYLAEAEKCMLKVFKEMEKKVKELEEMRIMAQTGEIIYRQKGELPTADRFRKAEEGIREAIRILAASV